MKNTDFLIALKEELEKKEISWGNDYSGLFDLIVEGQIPFNRDKKDNPNGKDYSNGFFDGHKGWLGKTTYADIRDSDFKTAVSKTFNFDKSVWTNLNDDDHMKIIQEKIAGYVNRTQHNIDLFESFDLSSLDIKDEFSDEQKDELHQIRGMDLENIKEYFHENSSLSQSFLLKIIPILYSKGFYETMINDAIDKLDAGLKNNIEIQKMHAHALGSAKMGKYVEAFRLLDSLGSNENIEEFIDLKTAAISNIRRNNLSSSSLDIEKLKENLLILVHHYEKIYNAKETYNYYPGVNLAYIVSIGQIVFESDEDFNQNISDIYKKSESSIKEEKENDSLDSQFYANISELEFLLLLNRDNFTNMLESYLDENSEKINLVELERTSRQLEWFVDIVERFTINTQSSVVLKAKKAIEIIEDFIEFEM